MSDNKRIDVCYASSDEFAIHTGISLLSLLHNNKDFVSHVYMLDYDISDDNKERLTSICERYDTNISFIYAKDTLIDIGQKTGIVNFRSSFATYSRAFLDMLLPESVDRVLYVDSDTVIISSIEELAMFDMNEKVIAGTVATNFYPKRKDGKDRSPDLNLINGNKLYIQCGILLYSLKNWRINDCRTHIFETCKKLDSLRFADQTLINNAIDDRLFGIIPLRYNVTGHNFCPSYYYRFLKSGNWYTDDAIKESLKEPAIVHFCGTALQRPWFEVCASRQKNEYYKYKAMSPWKDVPIVSAKEYNANLSKRQILKNNVNTFAMKQNSLFLSRLLSKISFYL